MAITTDGKINEMLKMDKADGTVQAEYQALKSEHNSAITNKKMKKIALDNARVNWETKSQKMSNISLLNPIKKYKAYKEMVDAKNKYKTIQKEYKIAKQNLKESQRKLRVMRSEVRVQYKSIKQNEKMNKRVKTIQKEHYTSLSLQDIIEYNKQTNFYNNAKYHIDRNNPNNNTFISPPRSELYSNINKTYAKHLKEKAKSRLKDTKENIAYMTRQVGNQLRNNEPELEM